MPKSIKYTIKPVIKSLVLPDRHIQIEDEQAEPRASGLLISNIRKQWNIWHRMISRGSRWLVKTTYILIRSSIL